MIIASICLLQMIVSLLLDSRYDVGPLENLFLDAVVSVIIIGSYRSVAIHTVEGLFLAGILILLALSGWQYYNGFLYHGRDRRKAFKRQSLKEVARLYGMKEQDMEMLQSPFQWADVFCRDGIYYYQPEGKEPVRIGMLSDEKNSSQNPQAKVHQPL